MRSYLKYIFILFVFTFSCTPYNFEDFYFYEDVNCIEDIQKWVNDNIEYKKDTIEEWASPQRTLYRGYGDCEDFAILIIAIAHKKLDKKCSLLIVQPTSGNCHATVFDKGKVYDSTSVGIYEKDYFLVYEYKYDNIPMY